MKSKFFTCLSLLVLTSVLPFSTQAAETDCKKTEKRVEKAICGDLDLTKYNNKIRMSYNDLVDKLSADGKRNIKISQDGWLADLDGSCDSENNLNACLKSELKSRLNFLTTLSANGILAYPAGDKKVQYAQLDGDDKSAKAVNAVVLKQVKDILNNPDDKNKASTVISINGLTNSVIKIDVSSRSKAGKKPTQMNKYYYVKRSTAEALKADYFWQLDKMHEIANQVHDTLVNSLPSSEEKKCKIDDQYLDFGRLMVDLPKINFNKDNLIVDASFALSNSCTGSGEVMLFYVVVEPYLSKEFKAGLGLK